MVWEGTRDNADVSALPSSVYLLRFASGSLFQNRAFSMIGSAADSEVCLGPDLLWYVGLPSCQLAIMSASLGRKEY